LHGGSGHAGIVFADAAHHGAQMQGFHNHSHTLRLKQVAEEIGDLTRQALLHLKAAAKHLHNMNPAIPPICLLLND
jgi:hypothetical protein